MDITLVIELILIIVTFFAYKYGIPLLKGTVLMKIATRVVHAANELQITKEITDKAQYAWDEMVKALQRYKIKFDEDEVKSYIKQAVTILRTEISGTDAEAKIEE